MECIVKFVAVDGKEFSNKQDCLKYEGLIRQVDVLMSVLPALPDDIDFSNGGGYIQHDKRTLRNVQVQLLELCKDYVDHQWIQQSIDDESVHPSYVGRLLGEYDIKPLYTAWYRFMCLDSQHREWGQPYYANNPDKGKQVRWGGKDCLINIVCYDEKRESTY